MNSDKQPRYKRRDSSAISGATELEWINSEVRLLGKSYGRASRSITEEIERGSLVEVK